MVGAVALHREAPEDPAGRDVDADDVGEARPRDRDEPPVVRREHVVDELVVALADRLADREEEGELVRVREISAIRASLSGMTLKRCRRL